LARHSYTTIKNLKFQNMKKQILPLIVMLFLGLVSCEEIGVRGHGDVVSEFRDLNDFTAIKFRIDGDVYLTQEATQEVRVEAYENIIHLIETRVENGELTIYSDKNIRSGHLKIFISAVAFDKIQLSGSGNIESLSCINVEDLELSISGSGNIEICGSATTLDAKVSGSGNINAYGIEAEVVQSRVSGSGNIKVTANESLEATITGSGNIYYKGSPQVNSHVQGSGRVVNKN
jgi:hypothetical protein